MDESSSLYVGSDASGAKKSGLIGGGKPTAPYDSELKPGDAWVGIKEADKGKPEFCGQLAVLTSLCGDVKTGFAVLHSDSDTAGKQDLVLKAKTPDELKVLNTVVRQLAKCHMGAPAKCPDSVKK